MIRVDTLEEFFDVADVVTHQPLPRGRGVAIVGNAGGPGVLAADACEAYGLSVPELSAHTQERLRSVLSPNAAVANPVDCIASATAEQYRQALEIVLVDEAIDSLIVIFTPPLVTKADDVARAVASVAAGSTKPIVANFFAPLAASSSTSVPTSVRVPWFAYPESAARALARIVPYTMWRQQPEVPAPLFNDIDRERGRAVVAAALAGMRTDAWLGPDAAASCSVPIGSRTSRASAPPRAPGRLRRRPRSAYPVALKIDVPGIVHKTDVGGVQLGLASAEEVTAAE